MNIPVIGIRLSDGTFYPVLKRDTAEKKRLILAVANRDQDKAVIEVFRGRGESMEEPENIGSLVVSQVGGAGQDIELVLERLKDGNLKAVARIAGSKQAETLEVRMDQGVESDDSHDLGLVRDDELVADGIDDFSLEGLEGPSFDAADETETPEPDEISVDASGDDEDLVDFDLGSLGGEESETVGTEAGAFEGEDGADELSFDFTNFGEEDSSSEALSGKDGLDLGNFSLDASDEEPEPSLSKPVADFSLDEISLEDEVDSVGSSLGDLSFDSEENEVGSPSGGFAFESSEENFDLGDDFRLDDAGTLEGGADFKVSEKEALPDELSWSPLGSEGGASDSVAEQAKPGRSERASRQQPQKEKKVKEKKQTKPKKDPKKVGQPDRVSLILGLIVIIPLALLLFVLVVLNMIRPALIPPLTQVRASPILVMEPRVYGALFELPKLPPFQDRTSPLV